MIRTYWRVALVLACVVANAAAYVVIKHIVNSPTGGGTSVVTDTPADEQPTDPATMDVKGPLWLAADPAGNVLRVSVGRCDGEASQTAFAKGPMGGAEPIEIPGLQVVQAVARTSRGWQVIGSDERCAKSFAWTADVGAQSWKRGPVPKGATLVQLKDRGLIQTPIGVISPLCLPQQWSFTSEGLIAVVCDNTVRVQQPQDKSQFNVLSGSFPGAVAAVFPPDSTRVLGMTMECGAQVSDVREGGEPKITCVSPDKAGLGMALAGNQTVIQAGNDLMTAGPNGKWKIRK